MKIFLIISLFCIFWLSCDQGLAPDENVPEITGIEGTILFQNWPPPDSLYDLRLVAFKNFPPENIFVEIITQLFM